MRGKIKTVIIGMGKMGGIRYKTLKQHGGFYITGICDIEPQKLKNYKEKGYCDWRECIDICDPDAVFVCAVNRNIPEMVCYALEKGIAVFSEKPPGRSLKDALLMEETQKRTGGILKFGFNHRAHNSVIEAKALVDSGILGEIVCIRGVYGKAGNQNFEKEWRNSREISGGGILLDQGIHMLDLMCYLTSSDLHVVSSTVSNLVWKELETEDSVLAILEATKGQLVTLHSSAIQWKHKFDMDVICTGGYIALNGLLTASESYGEERITYYKKDLAMKTGRLGKPKEYTMCFDEDDSWNIEIEDFYEAMTEGAPILNGTPEDAVRVMRVVEEIYGC